MRFSWIYRVAWGLVGISLFVPRNGHGRDNSGLARERVDLIKLIDPKTNSVAGAWKVEDGKLTTTGKPFDRIEIPFIPPEEYDVLAVAERHGGSNSVNLGLAVGEIQFLVILDADINAVTSSGLDQIGGVEFYRNPTTYKGKLFTDDKPSTVRCTVRKSRITVTVDGKKVIDWDGDFKKMNLYSQWKVPHKNTLFVGTWTGVVQYHKLEIISITGRGKELR